jgi:hypothetical protein
MLMWKKLLTNNLYYNLKLINGKKIILLKVVIEKMIYKPLKNNNFIYCNNKYLNKIIKWKNMKWK